MFDFINNLYRKNDHSAPREAGVTQIIEALPADNPAMALEELTSWLQALAATEGINLKERVKRLARIDQSGQRYERALRRQYTDTSRMHKVIEERMWSTAYAFLEATIQAHLGCLENSTQKGGQQSQDIAIVIMRTLRRIDLLAHWLHLRYRPLPYTLWNKLFFVIQLAEERDVLNLLITLNSAAKLQTTVAQEMLKLLMMTVAAPEHLTKTQIDLARVLTHNLAGHFCWEPTPDNGTVFHVDFSKPKTPLRLSQVSDHHCMLRSFGSGEALRALAVGFKQLEHGSVPAALGLLDFACYKRADLREVIAHLSQCWCKTDTHSECVHFDKRLAKRAQEFHQISVVPNFHLLYERLALRGMPPPNGEAKSASVRGESMVYQEQVDIQIYGFIPDKTREKAQQMRDPQALSLNAFEPPASRDAESWVVENISRMGYGVSIVRLKEDWVQSNTVIGIQADNAPWQICVIRRVVTETVENMQAGIQILSTKPHAALLYPAENEMSIWEAAADTQISHRTPSILMDEEAPYQNEESLLLVSKTYQLQRIYTMLVGGAWRTIRLQERINAYRNVDQIIFADVKQPRNVNH